MSRPEFQAPPEIFYNESEARKYTSSSRITEIQAKLSERALELLALPDDDVPRLLLDIGCGSGLSGETLSESGHQWIGLDISDSMLSKCNGQFFFFGKLNCPCARFSFD
ncbi:18S rRNA (guanine-N(7))-methyltransferase RID2-like isoform X1 [Papaver somniferum]|uniref:18S rRNA (guanine-N(7))-methyltransferase RID2-like isoform X1 n=1 Tax=Papaver somniferum TaxID=3469 RepID=UPI000E6FD041|nr:18S rRNA (guanine-N(7))-methyltransferase RID2-like isoform X1 [Papaver somniferum]